MDQTLPHDPYYTRLFLIRHARTTLNAEGKIQGETTAGLDSTGISQAERLAERLRNSYTLDHLFSSPYPRAQQTAAIIAQAYDMDYEVLEDLKEINFGEINNLNFRDLENVAPEYYQQINSYYSENSQVSFDKPDFPGGEKVSEIKIRIINFSKLILSRYNGKSIAAVSHGAFLKYLLAYYCGIPLQQPLVFWMENTSLSVIDFFKGRAIVRCINDAAHLNKPLKYYRPDIF